jgi:versiconal hemiacetal acetate esterase
MNADLGRFFTVGQSAGGNLALAVVRKLVTLGRQHEVKGVASIIPFALHPGGVPTRYLDKYRSFDELADGPVSTKRGMTLFYGQYCVHNYILNHLINVNIEAVQASPTDPDVYVLTAEAEELRQFPPTYLAVCGIDPLRDDGLILKDVLESVGYVLPLSFPSSGFCVFLLSKLTSRRVPVQLEFYKGLPHAFWAFGCPAPSGDFVGDTVTGIKNFMHT